MDAPPYHIDVVSHPETRGYWLVSVLEDGRAVRAFGGRRLRLELPAVVRTGEPVEVLPGVTLTIRDQE